MGLVLCTFGLSNDPAALQSVSLSASHLNSCLRACFLCVHVACTWHLVSALIYCQGASRHDQSQEAREMAYLSSLFVFLPTSLYSCTCLCVWRACVLCSFLLPGRPIRQDLSKDGLDIAFFQSVIVSCFARLVIYLHLPSACELVLGGRPTVACISCPALLRMCWCDCILSSR